MTDSTPTREFTALGMIIKKLDDQESKMSTLDTDIKVLSKDMANDFRALEKSIADFRNNYESRISRLEQKMAILGIVAVTALGVAATGLKDLFLGG